MARPRVLIVGGGPGGIACGIWASRLGLAAHLLEGRPQLGGQLLSVLSPITDYPGIREVDGPSLAARFVDHVAHIDVDVTLDCRIVSIEPNWGTVTTATNQTLTADAVIVATGALRRQLGLDDEARLVDRGVSYSVSKDRDRAAGAPATIVGGGDSAVEGAVSLAAVCPQVHLVYRGPLRARPDFVSRARQQPNIRFHEGRRVVSLSGADHLAGLELDDGTRLDCSALFIRIGVVPATSFVARTLPLDDEGFLRVDENQCCAGRVYAVGDVCSPRNMAVAVAVGQAMVACKHIQSHWR